MTYRYLLLFMNWVVELLRSALIAAPITVNKLTTHGSSRGCTSRSEKDSVAKTKGRKLSMNSLS